MLTEAGPTTHLVFGAYIEGTSEAEQVEANLSLLKNTLNAAVAAGDSLRHVTLFQGMKYYGAHLGAFKTPAREDDPRLPIHHFYYAQQDLLAERAERDGFGYTVLRPEAVWGYAKGTPMNLLMAIAAYVAITRHLGLPLRFPGPRRSYQDVIYQSTDAQLLARAAIWAGQTPAAWGQAFNITNGDVYRWEQMWVRDRRALRDESWRIPAAAVGRGDARLPRRLGTGRPQTRPGTYRVGHLGGLEVRRLHLRVGLGQHQFDREGPSGGLWWLLRFDHSNAGPARRPRPPKNRSACLGSVRNTGTQQNMRSQTLLPAGRTAGCPTAVATVGRYRHDLLDASLR